MAFILVMMVLTYGISGVFSAIGNGDRYLFKNYFQSVEYQERVNYFANLLSLYELNGLTKEEAKRTSPFLRKKSMNTATDTEV